MLANQSQTGNFGTSMLVNSQKTPDRTDIRRADNVDSRKMTEINPFRNFIRTRICSAGLASQLKRLGAFHAFGLVSTSLLLVASKAPLLAQVQITEFMASNTQTLRDDFGQYEDWIEIYNNSTGTVNLVDWALTDNADDSAPEQRGLF
jgi:hypothetical protein